MLRGVSPPTCLCQGRRLARDGSGRLRPECLSQLTLRPLEAYAPLSWTHVFSVFLSAWEGPDGVASLRNLALGCVKPQLYACHPGSSNGEPLLFYITAFGPRLRMLQLSWGHENSRGEDSLPHCLPAAASSLPSLEDGRDFSKAGNTVISSAV